MTARSALRALALGAGISVLALGTTGGFLFARPLPTVDGYFRLLGLDERAEVVRDIFGTPHISAADAHDLYFLQGYVTAQDRLTQMDQLRDSALAGAAIPAVPDRWKEHLEAYAAGINKFVAQHAEARALPGELVLAGRRPRPWRAEDAVAIASAFLTRLPEPTACATTTRTLRGRPLLAADLYLDATGPGWYLVVLEAGGDRTAGASLPGVPGIVSGHNGWIAWSMVGAPGVESALDALLGTAPQQRASGASAFAGPGAVTGCVVGIDGAVVGTAQAPPELAEAVERGERLDVERARVLLGLPRPGREGVRLIVDLSEVDGSRVALSRGESGQQASPHYRDQADLWAAGQLRRLPFSRPPAGLIEGELILRAR